MRFVHMSGAGNYFLVADGRAEQHAHSASAIREIIIAHPRNDGLPIEGVLIMRACTDRRLTAEFYNPDGSHGMMCGNGARCIVRFAIDHGLDASGEVELYLNGMRFVARTDHDDISVDFPAPRVTRHYPIGSLVGIDVDVWYIDVGSDHVVIDGPLDAQRPEVLKLRHHEAFPRGTNVNMVHDNDVLRIATFERGVEAITGACGTGALSCAVVRWIHDHTKTRHTLLPPSGRPLRVELHVHDDCITNMTLIGDAKYDND